MDDYAEEAGRLLADRYRLPRPLSASYQLTESVAYDTASGQEVLVRQVPLPEVVEAEVLGSGGTRGGGGAAVDDPAGAQGGSLRGSIGRATRTPADPVVRRAVEAAIAAARLPDHPRLDQVFDVFVEGDGLWIVSELLPATPLATLLSHQTLTAHRAAEIAADLLTALRVVHAHGWTHRNVTAHTVLICDDGRALLTGLAVGAAQEALCGYNPLPDSGRVALPPRGDIPGEPRPGRHLPGEQRPYGHGGGSGGRAGGAGAGDPGSPGAGAHGSPGAGAHGSPGTAGEGPGEGPATSALPGISLPEGFDVQDEDEPYGHGDGPGSGREAGSGAGRDYGSEAAGGADPGDSGGGPRGIFGLRSLGHDGGAADQPRPPVRHGYETGGRGPRAGAVAAYQEGARRGAAVRAYGPGREDRRDQPGRQERRDDPGQRDRQDRQDREGAREDWWNRASSPPPAADPHTTPDDFVRWLPSGEDEVTPSDLPGSRPPNSLPVKATWRSAEPERHEPREPRESPGSGREPGTATGPEAGGARAEEPYAQGQYTEGQFAEDQFVQGAYAEGPYTEGQFAQDSYDEEPYDEDPYAEEPESRPWGGEGADDASGAPGESGGFRGPATALAAERARQARMTVVGAVSERWAPEQAGPVHRNWRLAPPVGPSADLWALGVLLFRAVQGHGPYPEDDVAELVQMVCGEPPAFAEECGPLRPVVESLLRQDPMERPDFEELRGWLRSLVRSAPEPDVGWHTVYAPSLDPGGTSDPRRLPILRRRGELVRRRRAARRAARAEQRYQKQQKPPKQKQPRQQKPPKQRRGQRGPQPIPPPRQTQQPQQTQPPPQEQQPAQQYVPYEQAAPVAPPKPSRAPKPPRPAREKRARDGAASPRRLGGLLVGLVLAGLVAALMYAVWFMPKGGTDGASNQQRGAVGGENRPEGPGADGKTDGTGQGTGDGTGEGADGQRPPAPAGKAPKGYKLSRDPAGFQIAVPEEWDRRSTPGHGQVRYNGGPVEMVVVNGRDSVAKYGKDPMGYQSDHEPELKAYRASEWASTSGLRRIDVGEAAMAEGTFSWKDGGRDVYARNRAMILDGRYHVLMVIGSKSKQQEIDRHFEAVADTYRSTRR